VIIPLGSLLVFLGLILHIVSVISLEREGKKRKTEGICPCPGFSQDRVNFHKMPQGDTAGRADPN